MEERFIYNYIDSILFPTLHKYGLCSQRKLYELDRNMFHKSYFEKYKERASYFLNKELSKINDDDILLYLDDQKRINKTGSDSISFSILPIIYMKNYDSFKNTYELKINALKLQQYSPFIFYNDEIYKTTWNDIFNINNIEKVKRIMIESKCEDCLNMKNIPHIFIKCDMIEFNLIDGITRNWNRQECKRIIVNDRMQSDYVLNLFT